MAAKKREIYARAAVQLRTHERAIKAERICPGAMGLYLFLLLDSRGEQSAGDVAELVAMCSWGAPTSYRKKQAEALIAVGLVERRDDRLVVSRYEEHNDTPFDIAAAREAARTRKVKSRVSHGDVTRDSRVSHAEVPISISSSLSLSGSDLEIARAREAPDPTSAPPEWWADALEAIAMNTGETLPAGEAWLRYAGHRAGKGRSADRADAVYWLTTVLVPERRKARDDARHRDDRDAKFDRERARQRAGPNDPEKPSKAEIDAFNAEMRKQMASRKGAA